MQAQQRSRCSISTSAKDVSGIARSVPLAAEIVRLQMRDLSCLPASLGTREESRPPSLKVRGTRGTICSVVAADKNIAPVRNCSPSIEGKWKSWRGKRPIFLSSAPGAAAAKSGRNRRRGVGEGLNIQKGFCCSL